MHLTTRKVARLYITAVHFFAMSAVLYLLVVERNYRNNQLQESVGDQHSHLDNIQDSEMRQDAARMKRPTRAKGLPNAIDNMQARRNAIDKQLMRYISGDDSVGAADGDRDGVNGHVAKIDKVDNLTTKMVNGVTVTDVESNGVFAATTRSSDYQDSSKNFIIGLYCFYHSGIISQANQVNMNLCQYSKCSVKIIDHAGIGPFNVDAMLFQGNHLPPQLPIYRTPDQAFVFFSSESPQHLRYMYSGSNWRQDYFNWTMTYRLDSDIPYLYGRIVPNGHTSLNRNGGYSGNPQLNRYANRVYANPPGIAGKDYDKVFNRKTKHAAWLVSHCETVSKREDYVKEMQQHITIDIFGACTNRQCNRKECERVIEREYKFYIAFENSICKDYITEKVYRWFDEDILVVVRGARNYKVHLPRGTFINADHFRSPRDLALYLNSLAANKREYIRMLKRKDSYGVILHQESIQNAYCMLCERLHNVDEYRKTVPDIHKWWTKDICEYP